MGAETPACAVERGTRHSAGGGRHAFRAAGDGTRESVRLKAAQRDIAENKAKDGHAQDDDDDESSNAGPIGPGNIPMSIFLVK